MLLVQELIQKLLDLSPQARRALSVRIFQVNESVDLHLEIDDGQVADGVLDKLLELVGFLLEFLVLQLAYWNHDYLFAQMALHICVFILVLFGHCLQIF